MFLFGMHLVVCFTLLSAALHVGSTHDCRADPSAKNYRGNLSVTVSGRPCQKWSAQGFHAPGFHIPASTSDEDHNYCRHVYAKDAFTAWCVTTHNNVRGEYCALGDFAPECRRVVNDPKECYVTAPALDYRGTVNVTRTGIACQKWTHQAPHQHPYTPESHSDRGLGDHNYCRNPASYRHMAWCYTTDDNIEWEFCNIGIPSATCSLGCDECSERLGN